MTSDLALGDWSNPAEGQVDGNGDDANDPEHLAVILAVVTEDDGKDDTAQVACCACTPRDNA